MEAELLFRASCCMRDLVTQYFAYQSRHQQIRVFCSRLDTGRNLRKAVLVEAAATQFAQQMVLNHLPQAIAPEGLAAGLEAAFLFEPLAELIHLYGKLNYSLPGAGDGSHDGRNPVCMT